MKRNLISITGIAISVVLGLGLAWAGSDGGVKFYGLPVFFLAVGFAFALQWICFIPAFYLQTEKYFDLVGSLTYISAVIFVLAISEDVGVRELVLGGFVLVWALRLGSFLFSRVRRAGEDSRFRSIKTNFLQFLMTWSLQGLWVSVTGGAVLAALTSSKEVPLGPFFFTGIAVSISGFVTEVIADFQKTRFNENPENARTYINTGLWRWSRHPNYFGEIIFWTGLAIISLPALVGWQHVTLISPLFVFVLLTRISGINLLERKADLRWGNDVSYQRYKSSTNVLIVWPFKQKDSG